MLATHAPPERYGTAPRRDSRDCLGDGPEGGPARRFTTSPAPATLPPTLQTSFVLLLLPKASTSSAFRIHSLIAGIAFTLVWGATVITTFAFNDYYWPTTIIPVFGTLITMIRISSTPGASFYPGALPLSILSTVAQIGLFAYLIVGLFIPPGSNKVEESPRAVLVPTFNGVALVGRF